MRPDVGKVLRKYAEAIDSREVALLLSGGIDSASIMFSLLEAGKVVTAYSFMLDGLMSRDFSQARINARKFNCEFIPVFLPTSIDQLKHDLLILHSLGARSKTDYECGWPMLYVYKTIKEPVRASGLSADTHFCLSKKGILHYKDRIDEFRRSFYTSPTWNQQHIHRRLAQQYNKQLFDPYKSKEMQEEFLGTTWVQVNKPKQKHPIVSAYPEQFRQIKILPHTNLQLGDSGIAKHFESLLTTDWNAHKGKSVVGIYNRINKGCYGNT
jgi:asparagine synthetase B (glutamine-hydrolysing)